jgi:acyl dehydratase
MPPLDYARVQSRVFPDVEATYTDRDTMLYALGIGLGGDPTDPRELPFVSEPRLRALPTMVAVVARDRPWLAEMGIAVTDAVHGEQRTVWERPLPAAGTVIGKTRLAGVVDKGPGRGALILVEQRLFDKATGERLSGAVQTSFIRWAGGFGGPAGPVPEPHRPPDRAPDVVDDFRILPQAALIYRLSGDRNPLHFDPEVARRAGFPRPILHGFCTYGIAGWQVLRVYGNGDPARLAALDARFSTFTLPGESLRTEMWRDADVVSFRSSVRERSVVSLSHGYARIRE